MNQSEQGLPYPKVKLLHNFVPLADLENPNEHNNSAQNKKILEFGIVIGKGIELPKTWFTEVTQPPGGRMAQSKMAASVTWDILNKSLLHGIQGCVIHQMKALEE